MGEQGVVVKGFFNPTDPGTVDPSTKGVHFLLEDGAGLLYDVNIPPGLRTPPIPNSNCDPKGKDGWKVVTPGTKKIWKYINVSGALPPGCVAGSADGIFAIIVKDLLTTPKAAFQFIVKSKFATHPHTPPHPVTLMHAGLALAQQPSPGAASPEAQAGQCAESTFDGQGGAVSTGPPKPFCKRAPATDPRKKEICKGI